MLRTVQCVCMCAAQPRHAGTLPAVELHWCYDMYQTDSAGYPPLLCMPGVFQAPFSCGNTLCGPQAVVIPGSTGYKAVVLRQAATLKLSSVVAMSFVCRLSAVTVHAVSGVLPSWQGRLTSCDAC
jgi:hypothetical protein